MTTIAFTVTVTPRSVQKGKRLSRQSGRAVFFSSPEKRRYQSSISRFASQHAPAEPFEGPVYLALDFMMPRPKGRPTRVSREAWKTGDPVPYETRGRNDLDNLMKGFVDGLEGFWLDDGQIVEARLSKQYHEAGGAPRVEVQIESKGAWQ